MDLNHCFEELERVIESYSHVQESKLEIMKSDRDQLAGAVSEKTQDLETLQGHIEDLTAELKIV